MKGEECGVFVAGRVEIDTKAPFRSVKEAVTLFGERILAGEIYATKLNQMQIAASKNEPGLSKIARIVTELEETKQSLEKAREERLLMANCLNSLKEELDNTKRELKQHREKGSENIMVESEIEEVKSVKNLTKTGVETPISGGGEVEFQRKRSVRFATPLINYDQVPVVDDSILPKRSSASNGKIPMKKVREKKKKKVLMPLIGGIFSKKKG